MFPIRKVCRTLLKISLPGRNHHGRHRSALTDHPFTAEEAPWGTIKSTLLSHFSGELGRLMVEEFIDHQQSRCYMTMISASDKISFYHVLVLPVIQPRNLAVIKPKFIIYGQRSPLLQPKLNHTSHIESRCSSWEEESYLHKQPLQARRQHSCGAGMTQIQKCYTRHRGGACIMTDPTWNRHWSLRHNLNNHYVWLQRHFQLVGGRICGMHCRDWSSAHLWIWAG